MAIELDPPQPAAVVRVVEALLGDGAPRVDPWWAAGTAEQLGGDDGAPAQEAWGGAGVVEP